MNHTASVETSLSAIMPPGFHAANPHLQFNDTLLWRAPVPTHPGTRAIELVGAGLKGLLSPTLSSRGGEGEETAGSLRKRLNSMAVHPGPLPVGEGGIFGTAKENCDRISAATKKLIRRIPEPIMCLPAILLSLLAGALAMSAFFGILLPMLLSVPAIGSQLGASGADAVCQLQYGRGDFAPITNAVSTATGIILKREDFNRPSGPVEPASFQLELASHPMETGTR